MRWYFDLDGVCADFYNSPLIQGEKRGYGNYPEMYQEGFFRNLPLIPGALVNLTKIIQHKEVWILSQPVMNSPHSYSEKAEWVIAHFPELIGRIILTQDKTHLSGPGRILVDDNTAKWKEGWENAGGIFYPFNEHEDPEKQWEVLAHICVPEEFLDVANG